jgi:hypothetical protein
MLHTVALAPFLATLTAVQTASELAPAAVDALRDDRRSETIAVGGLSFVDKVKNGLGFKALHCEVAAVSGTYIPRDPEEAYGGDFGSSKNFARQKFTRK